MKFEFYTYFCIWTASVIYSIFSFSFVAFKYFRLYKDDFNDFTEGLKYFTKRDKTDLEWESITFLLTLCFPWVFIYLAVAQVIKHYVYSLKLLKIWQILFTSAVIVLKLNYPSLILILCQPILFYIVNSSKFKLYLIWTTSGLSLIFLNYFKSILEDSTIINMFNLKEIEMFILVSTLFWINLKCTSFFLENDTSTKTIFDLLSYCLYPPTVFTGPLILYKNFECNYEIQKISKSRFKKLLTNICRILFWYTFCYVCLHFVYLNAVVYHPQLVEQFNSWSLYGFGYAMGQFFHLKYVVLYGMGTIFASFEDINVPNLPRCIGRIHLYSDMWKYFDPGLYAFLIRYIYFPLVHLISSKPIRSLICFAFVYIWHGLESHILVWAALNYSGILIENVLWPKDRIKVDAKKNSEQSWKRRTDCFVAAFLLAMSAISNFYFFAGMVIGNVFVKRILSDLFGNIVLIAVLYCSCQVSTELRTVPASKM